MTDVNSSGAQKPNRQDGSLIIGLIIILIGLIFLLRNFDILDLGHRWWALFFLIPVSYLFAEVWRSWRTSGGKFPQQARGSLIGLVTLLVLMFIFLLGLNWGLVWPVFIIIGGLSLLLTGWR